MRAYNVNDRFKRLYFGYHQPSKPTDQYNTWKEANANPSYPGPQQYFKTKVETFEKKKKKSAEDEEQPVAAEEGEKKVHYSDRKKMDKMVYKPMKTHIF